MKDDKTLESVYYDGEKYIKNPHLIDELKRIKEREAEILRELGWDRW